MIFAAVRERIMPNQDRKTLFEGLVRGSYKQAFSLAYRLTGTTAEAEDLVQETFVRAFRFFHRYDDSMPFNSWLYRIMSNAHVDTMRRKGRIKTISLETSGPDGATTWDVADQEATVDQKLADRSLNDSMQQALNSMTAEFRTAVLLADVEGLAYEEVAEIMNTSVGTVRSRIHRGRKQIRQHLMKHAPAEYKGYSDEL